MREVGAGEGWAVVAVVGRRRLDEEMFSSTLLPSIRVPCCSMLVLLPLVLVCPSECSSVCSSFRSPCVRRPSAVSPLFYLFLRKTQLGTVRYRLCTCLWAAGL